MSCSISEAAAAHLLQHCTDLNSSPADDVVVGVGGQHVYPKAVYDLEVVIYGFKLLIPTLVIPGQTDEMIVGSYAIKQLIHLMKKSYYY